MLEAESARCPYCGAVLAKPPKRKAACKACGSPIYVRKGALMTEDRALAFDWAKRSMMGTLEELDAAAENLRAKLGGEPRWRDAAWSLLVEGAARALRTPDFHRLGQIRYEQAQLLRSEGKDHREFLRESHRMELLTYRDAFDSPEEWHRARVGIHVQPGSCEACEALRGRIQTVREALDSAPIPPPECTCDAEDGRGGWCLCMYDVEF